MKVPVIRGRIGRWRYYVGVLTFKQISDRVSPSINDLYPSKSLSTLLQRELTDNFKSIKEYIEQDQERFFNALILALYNGDPQWLEVEFGGEFDEVYNVGFLDLPEDVIIFPVDGQHRVAGIIEALKEKPELEREQVPVVFIAHEDSPEGIKRTRKLFSTLNRRAKPVGENAQIALDEDDIISIITRELISDCCLFWGERLVNYSGKQIPPKNKDAFTSLVTLYQCNSILIQARLGLKGKKFKDYLLYRPNERVITDMAQYVFEFWDMFCEKIDVVKAYLDTTDAPAEEYRNEQGGNILFRPVVLTEFVKAASEISLQPDSNFEVAFDKLRTIKMDIASSPWKGVLWDGKKIITRVDKKLIKLLILQMCDSDYLSDSDKATMVDKYIAATNYEGDRQFVVDILEQL